MSLELFIWVFGAACGGIGSAVIFSFKLGSLITKNQSSMDSLSNATARLNELIAQMRKDHEDHKKDNTSQQAALWKAQDSLRERIVVLESEMKRAKADIEVLASR